MLKRRNRKYSKELRQQAVQEYLAGNGSYKTISEKYEILNCRQLKNWVKWYNGHKEFKERTCAKGEIYMTKGIKTSQEERAKIVAFCIEHGKDYGLTVEAYKVSYQQIYAWLKKYEEKGIDGLSDGRGRSKPEGEMTNEEKLRAENKILEARIKDLEIENALIKKLEELERGGR